MDYKLIISIIALLISLISLGWNIYIKIKSEKRQLLIQSYKAKSKDKYNCTVTLTNIGNKPIFIRRIEMKEKIKGRVVNRYLDYNKYKDGFENVPINPENWKTLMFEDNKHFNFCDSESKKFKETKIIVVTPKGQTFATKWFRQNNLR